MPRGRSASSNFLHRDGVDDADIELEDFRLSTEDFRLGALRQNFTGIVLASAAARPATLLLGSTTLPPLQIRGPPRHPPETPPITPKYVAGNSTERAPCVVENDAQSVRDCKCPRERRLWRQERCDIKDAAGNDAMFKGAPDMAPIEM